MNTELDPIVGNWYRHEDKGPVFRVVAFDEERKIIEIQHFDGDIEEIDVSVWYDMEIEPAEAPEDWTGPLDEIEADDLGYAEAAPAGAASGKPLEEGVPEEEEWEDETPEDERDEWDEGDSAEDLYGSDPDR